MVFFPLMSITKHINNTSIHLHIIQVLDIITDQTKWEIFHNINNVCGQTKAFSWLNICLINPIFVEAGAISFVQGKSIGCRMSSSPQHTHTHFSLTPYGKPLQFHNVLWKKQYNKKQTTARFIFYPVISFSVHLFHRRALALWLKAASTDKQARAQLLCSYPRAIQT